MTIKQQINRYLSGSYRREDANRIFRGLQNNEDCKNIMLKFMDEIWNESGELNSIPSDIQREQYRQEAASLLKRIKRKKINWIYWNRAVSIAASLILAFTAGWFILHHHSTISESVEYATISTSFGEIEEVQLPDGSNITLNSCSQITYPLSFAQDERKISLSGEAFFSVAHDEQKPFIITTNQFDVTVLGTEFNVKAYATDAIWSIDVKNGKVQVATSEVTLHLKANEQFKINLLSDEYTKAREIKEVASWQTGGLYFNQTPLRDVVNELERIYHCEIQFQQGQIFDNLISGGHSNKSLESVLQSIELTSGVHFRFVEGQKKILLFK